MNTGCKRLQQQQQVGLLAGAAAAAAAWHAWVVQQQPGGSSSRLEAWVVQGSLLAVVGGTAGALSCLGGTGMQGPEGQRVHRISWDAVWELFRVRLVPGGKCVMCDMCVC